MSCARKKKRVIPWTLSLVGVLNFNMDGDSRGKLALAGIGGLHCNSKGEILLLFSKNAGVKESNEIEVMTVLKIFSYSQVPFKLS